MTKQKPSRKPTKSTKPAKAAKSAKAKPAAKAARAKTTAAKAAAKAKKPTKAAKLTRPAAKAAQPAAKAAKSTKPEAKAAKAAAKPAKAAGKPAKASAKPVAKSKASAPKVAAAPVKPAKAAAKPAKPAAKPAKVVKAAVPARGKRVENGVSKSASQLTLALDASNAAAATAVEERQVEAGTSQSDDGDEGDDGSASDDEDAAEPAAESPLKIELKALLQASVEQALASARIAHHAAVEGATHEEARPENDKDTRGLEQSYLARGHAQRVAELEAGLASLAEMSVHELGAGAPIALGAIVKIEDADHERTFLVAPAGGGMVLPGEITVLTPTSPIGRALLGRGVDDECEVGSGAHARTLTILSVE